MSGTTAPPQGTSRGFAPGLKRISLIWFVLLRDSVNSMGYVACVSVCLLDNQWLADNHGEKAINSPTTKRDGQCLHPLALERFIDHEPHLTTHAQLVTNAARPSI